MSETMRGRLVRFQVRGDDYWGTGSVATRHDGGAVAIVGKVLGAHEGDTVELDGDWNQSPKYGRQFKVKACRVVLPTDVSGVVGWLASKLPQISSRRAEALVQAHGVEGLWAVLDAGDVGKLCETEGITPKRAQAIVDAYREHKSDRDRMVRMKGWGLTDNQIARIIAAWGDDAEKEIQRDPYQLMHVVDGFGWKRADEVARAMGVALDNPSRLAAGMMHAMHEASDAGHCYVADGKLVALVCVKVCGLPESEARKAWDALETLCKQERLVRHHQNVYLPGIAQAEARLAETFAKRAAAAREERAA